MIRALRPEDLDQVMQIWLDANLEAHCFLPESYWCDHMEEVRAALPAAQVFVYQDWEGLQGFAGLTGDYLAGLFVRRAARSRGNGRALLERAKEACGVQVHPIAALSKGLRGEEPTDAEALKKAGAIALSDDGSNVDNANLMRDAMIRAKRQELPVLCHCEDTSMVEGRAVNEGSVSRQLWLEGRPAIAEELEVMRAAMLAEETGARVHICHISTAKAVDIVRRMKEHGVPVTCETCPQYFTLTEDEILTQGSLARINPPLRTQQDVKGIIAGLRDGTIDAIATDHAPHSAEEKARPLTRAPSGMVGLETSLAVTLTALYHTGKMELTEIVRRMTVNPASILGLSKGRLALGNDADIVIFDPNEEWTVDPEQFASKGRNTPFAGWKVKGRVKYTIVGGTVIYEAP